jgi:predicted amidohydrolase YtcJ
LREIPTLFFGGRIYTMSPNAPLADAMIIRGERIIWVGTAAELSAVPTDSYRMIDLGGAVLLPGFVDSHVHLFHWARSLSDVNLDGAKSYEEVLRRIRAHVRKHPDAQWYGGGGWKKEQWRKPRWPHRQELDRIIPDRPAIFYSKDEHSVWANSIALQRAGVGKDSLDPEGGVVARDESGEPTGLLQENAAWLFYDLRPLPGKAEAKRILAHGFEQMLARGCVGVCNFDKNHGWELAEALDLSGELPVRVRHYFRLELLEDLVRVGLRTGFGSDYLRVGGIKMFADGALGSQTAHMLRPYANGKNRGVAVTSAQELRQHLKRATSNGLCCAIHAIGDLANRTVLDAIAANRHISRRFRHRIEHCQIVAPADVKRFSELGVIASMQPTHATVDIDLMQRYLGRRRFHSYRFLTFQKLGVPLAFGSDAPIEPLDPLAGIHAAVTGVRPGSRSSFNRNQLLSIAQAVKAYTLGGAIAVGEQHLRGSLEPGKLADLVILDRDIMRLDPEQILKTEVVATMVGGEFRYCMSGFES